MPTTIGELNTVKEVTLTAPGAVNASDFDSAAPISVTAPTVVSTATSKTVTAGSIAAIQNTTAGVVDYTKISTTDEINNDTLNRTAETLKTSVNTVLADFGVSIKSTVDGLRSDTVNSFTALTTDLNAKLSSIKDEQDTATTNLNNALKNLSENVSTQFATIAAAEAKQSNDIATQINAKVGILENNIELVKSLADDAQAKIAHLDDVYGTDSDFATKVGNVTDLINHLNEADVDIITAIDGTIDEVNAMRRTISKEITVVSGTGFYNFNLLAEGCGEFTSVGQYDISADIIGNAKAQLDILNKTKDGFDLQVTSNKTHFLPQPVDCSVTPVVISVEIRFNKRDPMSYNIDSLNSSFISTGTGTETSSNTVGAMILNKTSVFAAVGSVSDVSYLGATGTVTATTTNANVATATIDAATKTVKITAVAPGTATIVVTDNSSAPVSRSVSVTVA